jgi:glycosyltransferase involved in cell wall biosynthesis
MDPLITIITATYNSAEQLQRSIDSVGNQTYKRFEYIIIDGGSKDGSIDILKRNSNIISNWISESDNGVYDAWNKGIKLAKGEWIAFIGSDDVLYPDALQNYVNYIKTVEKGTQFISSKIEVVSQSGKVVKVFGEKWDWSRFRKKFIIAHPGSLHSHQFFKDFGPYNSNFKICGDYEMLLRAKDNLKVGFLDCVTLKMSLGGLSDSIKVIPETYRVIRHGGLPLFQAKLIEIELFAKYYIRHFFRLFGVYIKKRK